jgi:hypothetical protein
MAESARPDIQSILAALGEILEQFCYRDWTMD